jgi:NAD(P)-dependent dehydrogenase (short-subunit alcohol dehydrogenase family)
MARNPFSLEGRVAIVTGGGGGLGVGICTTMAAAGAAVVVAGRTPETLAPVVEEIAAAGGKAVAVEVDIADKASVEAMVADAVVAFGGVDILVNNAAVYKHQAWTEITETDWDTVHATNLKGYFLCARATHASMKARGHGRIINVASITFFGGFPFLLDYVASKGGVVAFTRALAREIGGDGITVNTVAPGAFPTDAEKIHPDLEGHIRRVLESQALKRRGTPEDIGNLMTFLASDAAGFITGQMVEIDGGWMMH